MARVLKSMPCLHAHTHVQPAELRTTRHRMAELLPAGVDRILNYLSDMLALHLSTYGFPGGPGCCCCAPCLCCSAPTISPAHGRRSRTQRNHNRVGLLHPRTASTLSLPARSAQVPRAENSWQHAYVPDSAFRSSDYHFQSRSAAAATFYFFLPISFPLQ